MKKFFLLLTCLTIGITSMIAQNIVKHTLERGETLETIAKRYGVTVEKIKELNPETTQFIYVGMELKIPAIEVSTVKENSVSSPSNDIINTQESTPKSSKEELYLTTEETETKKSDMAMQWALFFPEKDKVTNLSGMGFDMSWGASYKTSQYTQLSWHIGYKMFSSSSNSKVSGFGNIKTELDSHNITIPLEANLDLGWFCPYVGLTGDIAVKTKFKVNDKKQEIPDELKDDFALHGVIGLKLKSNNGFYLFGAFSKKLEKNSNKVFRVGFGYMIGKKSD